jgi:predicted ArsR family transcriptional regulator
MATALDRLGAATGLEAVARIARERGRALGADAVEQLETAPADQRGSFARLLDLLRGAGYEPEIEPAGDDLSPELSYDALVQGTAT